MMPLGSQRLRGFAPSLGEIDESAAQFGVCWADFLLPDRAKSGDWHSGSNAKYQQRNS